MAEVLPAANETAPVEGKTEQYQCEQKQVAAGHW